MKSNKKFIASVVLIASLNIAGFIGWWFIFSAIQEKKEAISQIRQEIETKRKTAD